MPVDVMNGSYDLRDLDHPTAGLLYEGKLVIDKTYGHAAYGCGSCCGYYGTVFNPAAFGGPPDIDFGEIINATESCGGYVDDVTEAGYNWGSSHTAVALLPSSTLHTVAPGSATGSVKLQLESNHRIGPGGDCQTQTWGPSQPVSVTPVITGGNTVWWFNGQDPNSSSNPTSVTLSSSGGSSTSWSASQVDAKVNLSSTTGQQITITSTGTHFSSQVGDISITAKANDVPSAPFTMTARTPWKLVLSSNPNYCFSSPQTYGTYMTYDVQDNLSTIISSDIYWNESVSAASCQNGSNWCNYGIQTGGGDTNPLQDIIEPPNLNVTPAPNPTPTCNGQGTGTTRYRSTPQVIYVGSDSAGQGVQAQSDLLGYYIDHGQHDSVQIPSQPPQ